VLKEIVSKLKAGSSNLDIRDLQIDFAKMHPEQILKLTISVLDEAPLCRAFELSILGLMPISDWDLLAAYAIKKFQVSEVAQEIVSFAALQKPDSLHPYLETFILTGNEAWTIPTLAWRGSGSLDKDRLLRLMEPGDGTTFLDRAFAFGLLLETRDQQVILDAIAKAAAVELFAEQGTAPLQLHLNGVGLEFADGSFRKLHSDEVLHIAFPEDYFPEEESAFGTRDKTYQPTWQLQDRSLIRADAIIGGLVEERCKICSNQLHRLLEFTDRAVLPEFYRDCPSTFVTCLTCQGKTGIWEFFFAHSQTGAIEHMYEGEPIVPELLESAFVPSEVQLVDTGPRWAIQDHSLSNSWENLHRVGGSPSWVQDCEYLKCPRCLQTMKFAAQIDSGLPMEDGSEWMWGDSGACYLFFCGDCSVTGVTYQCY